MQTKAPYQSLRGQEGGQVRDHRILRRLGSPSTRRELDSRSRMFPPRSDRYYYAFRMISTPPQPPPSVDNQYTCVCGPMHCHHIAQVGCTRVYTETQSRYILPPRLVIYFPIPTPLSRCKATGSLLVLSKIYRLVNSPSENGENGAGFLPPGLRAMFWFKVGLTFRRVVCPNRFMTLSLHPQLWKEARTSEFVRTLWITGMMREKTIN